MKNEKLIPYKLGTIVVIIFSLIGWATECRGQTFVSGTFEPLANVPGVQVQQAVGPVVLLAGYEHGQMPINHSHIEITKKIAGTGYYIDGSYGQVGFILSYVNNHYIYDEHLPDRLKYHTFQLTVLRSITNNLHCSINFDPIIFSGKIGIGITLFNSAKSMVPCRN